MSQPITKSTWPTTTVALSLVLSVIPLLSACDNLRSFSGANQGKKKVEGSVLSHGKSVPVWFVRPKGEELELVSVSRPKFGKDAIQSSVELLLLGPDEKEIEKGIASEIPRGTILLSIERNEDGVDLNLSKRFSAGGGAVSMQARLDQLTKTIEAVAGGEKVYLSIEGDRLTASNLDGLEIKQPIN
ncbi:MAG: GerMN domain-containing protein [Candidatus Obscuribacterales bacterium]|nr:GerMN domain-containing protein [Candidatus Obscuribacterales bacterium]